MRTLDRDRGSAVELPSEDEPFRSILFPAHVQAAPETLEPPPYFRDLNLERVVTAMTAGREEYSLAPFFHERLRDLDAIGYRHEVMRELQDEAVAADVRGFARAMRDMRGHLSRWRELRDPLEKEPWFLAALETYCDAVADITRALHERELRSRGFRAFRSWLARYVVSADFERLARRVAEVKASLAAVRYCVRIEGSEVRICNFAGEADYGALVEDVFARFRHGAVKDYRVPFRDLPGLNQVELNVLAGVAKLNPDAFGALHELCASEEDFCDATVSSFDREVQFYLACLDHVARLRNAGLSFCFPELDPDRKEMEVHACFDLALANERAGADAPVVFNDVLLRAGERIFVVSGRNQGGKTTFARMVGQLHHFAGLGCPVPGTRARLSLCDQIFTHFERQEDVASLRGKLHDDLVRIREILERATPRSVVILNELFASTTLADAVLLSRRIMARLLALDVVGVWVTFLDELSTIDERTVSVVTAIDPRDPTVRTFKLERRPADGLAYALAIAEKHHVTYRWIARRLGA